MFANAAHQPIFYSLFALTPHGDGSAKKFVASFKVDEQKAAAAHQSEIAAAVSAPSNQPSPLSIGIRELGSAVALGLIGLLLWFSIKRRRDNELSPAQLTKQCATRRVTASRNATYASGAGIR